MQTLLILVSSLVFMFSQSSCGEKKTKKQEILQSVQENTPIAQPATRKKDADIVYDLSQPTRRFVLDTLLNEISAIEWIDSETLAAVEDENGILYLLSTKDGSIKDKFSFWEQGGDFEGITLAGETIWILEAKGHLFEINNWRDAEKRKVQRHNTPLKKDNDAEGLCYDAAKNRLLIACKGSPLINAMARDHRAVYAFSIADKKLGETPLFAFDIPSVQSILAAQPAHAYTHENVLRKLSKGKNMPIMPSDIAIHPLSQDIYILASDGMALMRFAPDGLSLLDIWGLDPAQMPQPEGLCFSSEGDMWISSEARNDVPSLQFFAKK